MHTIVSNNSTYINQNCSQFSESLDLFSQYLDSVCLDSLLCANLKFSLTQFLQVRQAFKSTSLVIQQSHCLCLLSAVTDLIHIVF